MAFSVKSTMVTSKHHDTNTSETSRHDPVPLQHVETSKSIVIAGGGTGGHIYPAIGIAQALQRLDPTVDIVFVGGAGKLEATLVPKHDFRFLPISVAGFPRRITLQWFPVIWKAFRGLTQSLRYMTQLKPDIVIGTGGYVSGPVLLAALLRRIPIVIQEQNASIGLTNRVLARWAKAVYLAMASACKHNAFRYTKHIEVTGNPIRPAITEFTRSNETYKKFGLSPVLKTVFVMGGSQGARAINQTVVDALPHLIKFAGHIQIVHQTGAAEAATVQTEYEKHIRLDNKFLHCVRPFFDTVEEIYSIADVMICRAGGMTVAEVTACGIPAIFIPLPSQTGNDQVLNAHSVAKEGAAVVLEQGKFTIEMLVEKLTDTLLDINTHERMVTASRALGKPHASDDIAKSILSHV